MSIEEFTKVIITLIKVSYRYIKVFDEMFLEYFSTKRIII